MNKLLSKVECIFSSMKHLLETYSVSKILIDPTKDIKMKNFESGLYLIDKHKTGHILH